MANEIGTMGHGERGVDYDVNGKFIRAVTSVTFNNMFG